MRFYALLSKQKAAWPYSDLVIPLLYTLHCLLTFFDLGIPKGKMKGKTIKARQQKTL
jgi:hypothetical protein